MPLSAIVNSSVLFAAQGIGSSFSLEEGKSFQQTYCGSSVYVYGSGGNVQLDIEVVMDGLLPTSGEQRKANELIVGLGLGILTPNREGDKKVLKLTALGRAAEIDPFLYEPSVYWSFAGTTLLLDDQDESVSDKQNGTKIMIPFVLGSNLQIYGAVQQVAGNVTLKYTIDKNFSETITLSPTSQGVNRTNWELNRLVYGHSDKPFYADGKADHTLEVTVKEVTGDQMFTLDYLTFEGTPSTNVASGKALASPLPDDSGATRTHRVAFGLGLALPLGLMIGIF